MLKNRVLGMLLAAIVAITSFTPMSAAVQKKNRHHESSSSTNCSSHKKKYDYIIVGCGSAGSILARKLSDNHKNKVLVLEAGQNRNDDPNVLSTPSDPDFFSKLWSLINDPQYAEAHDIRIFAPTQTYSYTDGRGWGGGSLHNYLVAVRGTPDIYDEWAAISGNPLWSYNSMLPLMRALENYNSCGAFDVAQRGFGGPISITQNPPVLADPLTNALDTATTVGFIDDYNNPNAVSTTGHKYVGYSPAQLFTTLGNPSCVPGNQRPGERSFSGKDFLMPDIVTPDGRGRHGRQLQIESNSYATQVLFNGKKAVGVEYIHADGSTEAIKVYGKKIILCAGAINSAAILQRSGIGDPEVLEPLGIDVRVDNPLVGNNIKNQYGVLAVAGIETSAYGTQCLWNLAANGNLPAFDPVYVYPDDNTRRIQVDLLQFGPTVSGLQTFILDSESRGSIKIVSKNPLIQPFIDLNMYSDGDYLTNGTDANKVVTALNLIASGVGAGNMFAPPGNLFSSPPGTDPANDAGLFNYMLSPNGISVEFHILNSTPMGTSIANGVVDGTLHVFGVKNLMVADIGVLPTLPDGNTCYSAYMVGLRAATMLGVPVPPAL